MDSMADPMHPDHVEYSEWVAAMTHPDETFDPSFFDIADVNRTLTNL